MERKIDIQKGHSYDDYRRYFGSEYDKGKILSFYPNELQCMDPNRQYWELKNEKGEIKYFELPKHVKPFTIFSPYCFNRIFHRRPARTAMLIAGTVIVGSITCSFVGKKVFGQKDFDIDVNVTDLRKATKEFYLWRKSHPGDITSYNLPVHLIANYAMGQTLYFYDEDNDVVKEKEKVLTIGHGKNDTDILISHVLVDISNAFIQNGDMAFEESISFGTMSLTRFGKRDYYNYDKHLKEVTAYQGHVKSSSTCDWNNEIKATYANEADYSAVAGKCPYQPFLYNITNETVLTDKVFDEDPLSGKQHFGESNVKSIKNDKKEIVGYNIEMDLHNVKSVSRYVKRMTYLSGQTPDYFSTIHLSFVTDSELKLKSSYVKEDYSVKLMHATGSFDTRYYDDNEHTLTIPKHTESIDYGKYPF